MTVAMSQPAGTMHGIEPQSVDAGAPPSVEARLAGGRPRRRAGGSTAGAGTTSKARSEPGAADLSRRGRMRVAVSLEIRQAARRILVRHGQEALTLRAIARDVSMTAPALYRYFGSLEDLITDLTADIFLEVTDDVRAATMAAGQGDVTARLAAARREFQDWSLSHPAEFRLLFAAPLPRVGQHDIATDHARRFAWAFLELFLERWRSYPIPAVPEVMSADMRKLLDYLGGWLQADLPAGAMLAFLRCWVQLHAAVALEVSGYPGIASDESGPIHAGSAWPQPGRRPASGESRGPGSRRTRRHSPPDTLAVTDDAARQAPIRPRPPSAPATGRWPSYRPPPALARSRSQSASTPRRSADERRAQVLEAAIHEFALHGLHGATTAAIAARAQISQPYLFALFRDKKALFLAT